MKLATETEDERINLADVTEQDALRYFTEFSSQFKFQYMQYTIRMYMNFYIIFPLYKFFIANERTLINE